MNTIYNVNCFDEKGLSTIPDNSINLVVTDPPYLHNKGGGKTHGTEGKSKIANSKMYNFDSPMMKNMSNFGEKEITKLLDEFKRIMKKMNCYIFCNDTLIPYYLNWAMDNNKKWTILVWEKPLSILNRNRFSQNLEYIIRIYDNGTALNKLDIDTYPEYKDLYSKTRKFNQVKGKGKIHPTQKPLEYIEGLVMLSSNENDVVLDPFMGSGTTAIACLNNNRNYIGFEMNEDYYNLANERIKTYEENLIHN